MDDIFDENGYSKINSIGTMFGFDPETKVFLMEFQHPLIKGSTLPANATMKEPIENPKGVNRWIDGEWIDDIDYGNNLKIEVRKEKIKELEESYGNALTKLTLKQSVGRINKEEEELRIKIINYLIDLDEFPAEDLSKEIPVFEE